MKRTLMILLAVLLSASLLLVPANANSAQSKWEGVDQSGAIIVYGDSPIVVEREVLTFDLQQFPQSYYRKEEIITTDEVPDNKEDSTSNEKTENINETEFSEINESEAEIRLIPKIKIHAVANSNMPEINMLTLTIIL